MMAVTMKDTTGFNNQNEEFLYFWKLKETFQLALELDLKISIYINTRWKKNTFSNLRMHFVSLNERKHLKVVYQKEAWTATSVLET